MQNTNGKSASKTHGNQRQRSKTQQTSQTLPAGAQQPLEARSDKPGPQRKALDPAPTTPAHAAHTHSRPNPQETRPPQEAQPPGEDQAADGLPDCPVEVALSFISSRWRILIIRDLLKGACRFSELQRSVRGISQKMLTSNLRAMADCGLVTRTVYAEVPPRVEYALTELGMSLSPVFTALESWGEAYKEKAASQACGATEGK